MQRKQSGDLTGLLTDEQQHFLYKLNKKSESE